MTKHMYEYHSHGIYFTDEFEESHLETCENCGYSDKYYGVCETAEDIEKVLKEFNYRDDFIDEVIKYFEELEKKNDDNNNN